MTRQEKEAKEENRTNEIPQDSTLSPFGMNYTAAPFCTVQPHYKNLQNQYMVTYTKLRVNQKQSIVVSTAAKINRVVWTSTNLTFSATKDVWNKIWFAKKWIMSIWHKPFFFSSAHIYFVQLFVIATFLIVTYFFLHFLQMHFLRNKSGRKEKVNCEAHLQTFYFCNV